MLDGSSDVTGTLLDNTLLAFPESRRVRVLHTADLSLEVHTAENLEGMPHAKKHTQHIALQRSADCAIDGIHLWARGHVMVLYQIFKKSIWKDPC